MEKSGLAVDSTNDDDDEKVKVRNQSHIHDDIGFSILSKLPIKSLKRFECVRKSWSLLFDNPNFMNMYRNNLLTKDHPYYHDTSILLHLSSYFFELYSISGERFENMVKLDWPSVNLEPLYSNQQEYDSDFDIIGYGSVHGTLCLLCPYEVNIMLWNPSTKQFKLIPSISFFPPPYWKFYGDYHEFGYDCVRDDYKVICHIVYIRHPHFDIDGHPDPDYEHPEWVIYSLRTNSWRKLDVDMHRNSKTCGQLYMDGLSHWLCDSDINIDSDYTYLLSFDWSNEVFLTTLLPPKMDDDGNDVSVQYYLLLLNGSIALSMKYGSTDTFHISILGELGVKESWTKIFIVGPFPCFDYPIGAGKKGDMLFRKKKGGIVWFDLNTQMVQDLGIKTSGIDCKIVIHKKILLPFEGANI